MARTRRLSALISAASDRLLLPPGDLIVALSGGADSAALAYLCVTEGREVRALHVNHGLAGSDLMEKAASAIAKHLGITLAVVPVSVGPGPSPEGKARRARYEAYASHSERDPLLTGHTRDDHVETVFLNAVRGTGPRGMTGIPYHRPPNIYRPILSVTRSETREIAGLAGLGFVDDPMNEDPTLTRNILRRSILPSLRGINPKLDDSIARMAQLLGDDAELLDQMAESVPIARSADATAVPIGSLVTAPLAVARRVLVLMLRDRGIEASHDRVGLLLDVASGQAASQELGGGVTARREGPMLVVSGDAGRGDIVDELGLTSGRSRWQGIEFDVVSHETVCQAIPLSKWAAIFPKDTRLVVRPDGVVTADGRPAWIPGEKRLPVAWYEPGTIGYLSVFARETGWR